MLTLTRDDRSDIVAGNGADEEEVGFLEVLTVSVLLGLKIGDMNVTRVSYFYILNNTSPTKHLPVHVFIWYYTNKYIYYT